MSDKVDEMQSNLELLGKVGASLRQAQARHLDYTAYLLAIAEHELIEIAYGKYPTSLSTGRRRKALIP